jgi:hypothetical protein
MTSARLPIAEGISASLFTDSHPFFPKPAGAIPFGDLLNAIFFRPNKDNLDYPIHGPNVVRLCGALLDGVLHEPGLIKGDLPAAQIKYNNHARDIQKALGVSDAPDPVQEMAKQRELLAAAALYHDIGKSIRRANHPLIGANLVRNFDEAQRRALVDALVHAHEPRTTNARFNRFSLITSIIQHHDKFGVVSTGEGGLPIFSDILYFASGAEKLTGVRKNVTAVMLLNMADIAAVSTADEVDRDRSLALASDIAKGRDSGQPAQEPALLDELTGIAQKKSSCLGLTPDKLSRVLDDWSILIGAIDHSTVEGNRVGLKRRLIEVERNPSRAIERILRLLNDAVETSGAGDLSAHFSRASVESILVGTLGAHQFQTFCAQLACVAKLDYGLSFFKAVACASVRRVIGSQTGGDWARLGPDEVVMLRAMTSREQDGIASAITILFVMVLQGLVTRYAGVLDDVSPNPRRFGFQLRDLTGDAKIRAAIIDLLCTQPGKQPIALTWIEDEISVWSMD